ncbi:MAG: transposase [Anaerolineae bacterium]|nr:transposase [Anaerolineae bacterium]
MRTSILRLREAHPRWGPSRILAGLRREPVLRGLQLPSPASIGRYLHQWPRFRRPPKRKAPSSERPQAPTEVHQRWQMDFKMGIPLGDGTLVNMYTVRDPVGAGSIGAFLFPAGRVGKALQGVSWEQARQVLRTCFARWGTLPREVQTDWESALTGHTPDPFPSLFTLWLQGLGIQHLKIRRHTPTDNAEVERCHRTLYEYAIQGNEEASVAQLQAILDRSVVELNTELPSRAHGCAGKPPTLAHPELLQPLRPFQPEHELALFALKRVDAYLSTFTWKRKVGKTGQVHLGKQRYSVGRPYARQQVLVRFSPQERHFVFYEAETEQEIKRLPAKGLDVPDLTGLAPWPVGLGPQQLPLPLPASPDGVGFQ